MSLDLGSTSPPPRSGVAPTAPGRLGSPIEPRAAFTYLAALGQWVGLREQELHGLDAAALGSTEADSFSSDMSVSMALWKAIADRYRLLEVAFDNGRVGPAQAEQLSALIWGRLDLGPESAASRISASSAGALGLSLPEACRLSDAMVSSLRARLALEPTGAEIGTRVADVRAGLERIRDQLALEPAGSERERARAGLTSMDARLADITDRAKRGADVGGLLGPLELEAAGTERDLLVAAGRRLEARHDATRATGIREELAARGTAIRALQDRCVAAVDPAPRLAVPDVTALGPVPESATDLRSYLTRLDAVSRALTAAHAAYADALAEREEVIGLAGALGAQASATGADTPDLQAIRDLLTAALTTTPLPIARARALLGACQGYLSTYRPPANRTDRHPGGSQ